MTIDRSCIDKILVIKLRAIGDVLLSTVVIPNLKATFPSARIDVLTERPSRYVVEGNPHVHSVLVFDGKKQSSVRIINEVRRQEYDLVIDLFGNPRSAIITLLSGALYRVGYRFKWRQYCYNIVVEPRGGEVHNTEFNLDALRTIDVPVADTSPSFPLTKEAEDFAERFFKESDLRAKTVVAINSGGGWYTKRWRIPQFAQLANRISNEHNAAIVIVWGPGEQEDAEQLKSLMTSKAVLIPPTNLTQLAAILKRCSAMVTNDSGPMHIGAAVETPVVAIFGPTRPELQGPVGSQHIVVQNRKLLCLGCNFTSCPIGNPCMEELSVIDVMAAFKQLVEKNHIFIEQ